MKCLPSILCELAYSLINKQANPNPPFCMVDKEQKIISVLRNLLQSWTHFCILLYALSNLVKICVKDNMKFDP